MSYAVGVLEGHYIVVDIDGIRHLPVICEAHDEMAHPEPVYLAFCQFASCIDEPPFSGQLIELNYGSKTDGLTSSRTVTAGPITCVACLGLDTERYWPGSADYLGKVSSFPAFPQ